MAWVVITNIQEHHRYTPVFGMVVSHEEACYGDGGGWRASLRCVRRVPGPGTAADWSGRGISVPGVQLPAGRSSADLLPGEGMIPGGLLSPGLLGLGLAWPRPVMADSRETSAGCPTSGTLLTLRSRADDDDDGGRRRK